MTQYLAVVAGGQAAADITWLWETHGRDEVTMLRLTNFLDRRFKGYSEVQIVRSIRGMEDVPVGRYRNGVLSEVSADA